MFKKHVVTLFGILLVSAASVVGAQAACPVPNLLQNTFTADANAVMGNFNSLAGCAAPLASPSLTGTVSIGTAGYISTIGRYSSSSNGQILWNNGSGQNLSLAETATNVYTFGAGFMGVPPSSSVLVLNTSSGNVGIGTNTPSYTLHVNGSAAKPGGGSWSDSSDRRLKTDISSIDGAVALTKLNQLNPVDFKWINPQVHGNESSPGGFVAQQFAKIFPEFVHTTSCQGADCSLVGGENSEEYNLSLPFKFDAYLVAGIQELSKRVDKLSAAQTATSSLVAADKASHQASNQKAAMSTVDFLSSLKELKAANENQAAEIARLEGQVAVLQRKLGIQTAQK